MTLSITDFLPTRSPSLYFRHATRVPHNVLMAWHDMPAVPRVGDHVDGPFGNWVVTRVVWNGTNEEMSQFASIEVHVRDFDEQTDGPA